MAALPPLIRQVRQIAAMSGARPGELDNLTSHVEAFRTKILTHAPAPGKHLESLPENHPTDFLIGDPVNDSCFHLQQFETVKRDILSWTAIIIANRLLQRLGALDKTLDVKIESAASCILSNIPLAKSTKSLGSLFITFSGPVVYGVTPTENQLLIHDAMNEMFAEIHLKFSFGALQLISDLVTAGPLSVEIDHHTRKTESMTARTEEA